MPLPSVEQLAFVFLIRDFQHTWHWKLTVIAAVTAALILVGSALDIGWRNDTALIDGETLLYEFPPARLLEFTIGMGAAFLWRAEHWRFKGGSRLVWTLTEIAAVLSVVATTWTMHAYRDSFYNAFFFWFSSASITLPAIALITIMAFQRGAISSLLAARPFVLLGEISYSFYLFHGMILYAISAQYPLPVSAWAQFVVGLAATLIISYLVWWLVETPMRIWIRGLGKQSRLVLGRGVKAGGV